MSGRVKLLVEFSLLRQVKFRMPDTSFRAREAKTDEIVIDQVTAIASSLFVAGDRLVVAV